MFAPYRFENGAFRRKTSAGFASGQGFFLGSLPRRPDGACKRSNWEIIGESCRHGHRRKSHRELEWSIPVFRICNTPTLNTA
jgi:hypothetical protein